MHGNNSSWNHHLPKARSKNPTVQGYSCNQDKHSVVVLVEEVVVVVVAEEGEEAVVVGMSRCNSEPFQ